MHSIATCICRRHCNVFLFYYYFFFFFTLFLKLYIRYLTKAIQEEGEMLGGANPKLVKTFGKRVHNCVPKDFPYCHVEWNRDRESGTNVASDSSVMPMAVGGLLHVVDDESKFPRKFVWKVLGGMMQLDDMQLKQLQTHEDDQRIATKSSKFKELFKTFDWTTK